MSIKMEKFFIRHHITESAIKYIIRENGKTSIYLLDNRIIETYIPLKTILEHFNEDNFLSINKGVTLAISQIDSIQNNEYIMKDKRVFTGRSRASSKQKDTEINLYLRSKKVETSEHMKKQFGMLDDMPLAFCVIELILDKNSQAADFIFRYCNKEMEKLEATPIANMINRSFYDVFPNGDPKWLVCYSDVALNGVTRIISDYSPEINRNLRIYCFQPEPNFCACALIPIKR